MKCKIEVSSSAGFTSEEFDIPEEALILLAVHANSGFVSKYFLNPLKRILEQQQVLDKELSKGTGGAISGKV